MHASERGALYLLQKLLNQTQLTDSLQKVAIVDPKIKLNIADLSFISSSEKNPIAVRIQIFNSIGPANSYIKDTAEGCKNDKFNRGSRRIAKLKSISDNTSNIGKFYSYNKENKPYTTDYSPRRFEKTLPNSREEIK